MSSSDLNSQEHGELESGMAWRVSEPQFEDLFSPAPMGLCLLTPEGKVIAADHSMCDMLGYMHDELLDRSQEEITYPEDRSKTVELRKRLAAGTMDRDTIKERYIRKDGSLMWTQLTCSALRLEQLYIAGVIEDIGRRKQVEDELRRAQERYSALFDGSMDCVYLLDLEGRILDANPAALSLLGYSREDIPKWDIHGLLKAEQIQLAKERIHRILTEGHTTEPAEFKVTRKDGQTIYMETRGSAVLHGGKPFAIQGIGRDITRRKRAEEELRESEEKFRSLAENMHAAIGIVQGKTFMYVNQYMAQMLGYSVEEILSMDFPRLVHPADRGRLIDLARRRQSGESVPTHYEFMALTKSGETRWIDFSVGAMLYHGNPAIIGTGIDLTERKRAEEQTESYARRFKLLSDSATRLLSTDRPLDALRDIFESVADHLRANIYINYMVTEDGIRLRLESQRGLAPDVVKQIELVRFGQTLCGTVAEEKRPVIVENVQQSTEPKAALLRPLGIRAYSCHPLMERAGVIGTISFCAEDRDRFSADDLEMMRIISHQAAMALEHQRLRDELEHRAAELTEANAAKDHFLAMLSHELRTPLTPVVMGLSILQAKQDLDPKIREALEVVRLNVDMEARLIDDLLDVTRIAYGKIELNRSSTELCRVIQRVIEICKADIEARGLHFGVALGQNTPYWVYADPARLQQVLWNLLKNAIKFTPQGGCVEIRCLPNDGYVSVEVNDSGIGIEPEALPRIFNAFEQTERSITRQFGGLGLGLAISKALVKMHGGEIEAQSGGRGKGATFRVRLPLSAPAGKSPKTPTTTTKETESITRPLRVLLVEDHGVTAQMFKMVLDAEGHTVTTAGDVATALSLADRQSFDLLLSDLGLPDGSGHDLMNELRKRGHQFPGIALSGYGQERDIHRSREAGFSRHLIKPTSREALLEAVLSIASEGHDMPSEVARPVYYDPRVFDHDLALRQCLGSPEMLEKMVDFFETDSAARIGKMYSALEMNDLAEVDRAAHHLRGTVSYLGAKAATQAAEKTEHAARSGDPMAAAEAIEQLQIQIELLRQALFTRDHDADS